MKHEYFLSYFCQDDKRQGLGSVTIETEHKLKGKDFNKLAHDLKDRLGLAELPVIISIFKL